VATGATRDTLVTGLVQSFDVDQASAAADVDRFLADLRQRGLLED
jgi:hypothetical protein